MSNALVIIVLIGVLLYMVWYTYFKKRKPIQRTFCYCPNCDHEMIGDKLSFVEDTDLVRFKCSKCGNKSEWNFDITPVALVVTSDNGYTDFKKKEVL
jgi:transcription elongation factor Elf1